MLIWIKPRRVNVYTCWLSLTVNHMVPLPMSARFAHLPPIAGYGLRQMNTSLRFCGRQGLWPLIMLSLLTDSRKQLKNAMNKRANCLNRAQFGQLSLICLNDVRAKNQVYLLGLFKITYAINEDVRIVKAK